MIITGWFNSDSVHNADCPRCGQTAGNDCRTPKGRKTNSPHTERTVEYSKIADMDYYRLTDKRQSVINTNNTN